MAITVVFTGKNGEEVSVKDQSLVPSGLSQEQIAKGWKSIMDNNLSSLRKACEHPHPYVPD
jgi:hypothetical protein